MDLNPGHEELDIRTRAHLPAIVLGYIQALPELPFTMDALTSGSCAPGITDSGRGLLVDAAGSGMGAAVGHAVRETGGVVALAEFVDNVLGGAAIGGEGGAIWGHSLRVAAFVEVLAGRLESFDRGAAFAAALLLDMGRLALYTCLPRAYARVVQFSDAHRTPLDRTERQQLGVDHADVGRALARYWGLPMSVRAAIGDHHEQVKRPYCHGPGEKLAVVVQLGERLHGQDERASKSVEELDRLCTAIEIKADELADVLRRGHTRYEQLRGGPFRRLLRDTLLGTESESGVGRRECEGPGPGSRELARPLGALEEFVVSATACEDACELCRAIVRCVECSVGVRPGVAFVADRRRGVYYCAVREGAAIRLATLVASEQIDIGSESSARGHSATLVGPATSSDVISSGVRTFVDAVRGRAEEPLPYGRGSVHCGALNEIAARVYGRFRHAFASEEALMLPLGGGERMSAGILFDAEVGRRIDELASDMSTLLMACLSSTVRNVAIRLEEKEVRRELADRLDRIEADQAAEVQNRSLSTVACMAAGAAHELNTPLAVISGRAQFLEGLSDDPEAQRWGRVIHDQSRRCSEIVNELLAFAKPAHPRPERVCLREAVAELQERFPGLAGVSEREFVVELADPDVAAWVDRKQFQTVWRAIVSNALEAMEPRKKGRVIINSASHSTDETVVVRLEDNGRGMSPDVLEHACDPFFSHRPAGRGRGLGLSVARRLIELNGGRLAIESAEDVGTVVTMELPSRAPGAAL